MSEAIKKTSLQVALDKPLGFKGFFKCLFPSIKAMKDGFGIQGFKATFLALSVGIKQDNYIADITQLVAKKWYAHKATIELAGNEVNLKDLENWYISFTGGENPSKKPPSLNLVEINSWLMREIHLNYIKNNRWNQKK
jgi:hypothetical protein